jgi:chloramphenicol-sensitive protein RarD
VTSEKEHRSGVICGLLAYTAWGIFPLYWPLMKPATPSEILAHRVLWSALTVGLVVAHRVGLRWLRALGARRWRLAILASGLIACNWILYIWAVNSAHVVESALGYFINPLVTVLLGVVVLKETLRRAQWIAIGLSALAVAVLALDYGRVPWVALALALSFALYGFVKKRAGLGALESLAIETGVLVPFALLFLVHLGGGSFTTMGPTHAVLLASTGIFTTLPLLAFSAAANRIPLSILGVLQYISPTLQFLCGVVVQHEPMAASRWFGFALVWVGLLFFAGDALLAARKKR